MNSHADRDQQVLLYQDWQGVPRALNASVRKYDGTTGFFSAWFATKKAACETAPTAKDICRHQLCHLHATKQPSNQSRTKQAAAPQGTSCLLAVPSKAIFLPTIVSVIAASDITKIRKYYRMILLESRNGIPTG